MDRAVEFLQSLQKDSPRAGLDSEKDVPWKSEYDKLKKEFELYKKWLETETEAGISGMEIRWSHLQTEAETMKLSLESQNRELTRKNSVLERQVTSLQEELEETRLVSHEQMKHNTTMKRQLKERCTGLELKVEEQARAISELTLQFTESKSRNERMYREMQLLPEQKEPLITESSHARLTYKENMNEFSDQCNAMLDKVASYYSDELQIAMSNYIGVLEQLDMSKELISEVLKEMKSKEEEFQRVVAALRERSKATGRKKAVDESLLKVAKERNSAVRSKEQVQQLLHDVINTVNELCVKIIKHQQNSTLLCGNALAIMGQEERNPCQLLNDIDYDVIKDVDTKNLQKAAFELTARFEREELKLNAVIKALREWKMRFEEKVEQFQGRISVLEKAISDEMTKHSGEMGKVLEKSKKYKKLVRKLRKKLKIAPDDSLVVLRNRKIPSYQYQPRKRMAKHQPRSAHSVAGHLDVMEELFPRKVTVKKSINSSSSESFHLKNNRTSAQLSTCSEYKLVLDDADCILKRIDDQDRASQLCMSSKEQRSRLGHENKSNSIETVDI